MTGKTNTPSDEVTGTVVTTRGISDDMLRMIGSENGSGDAFLDAFSIAEGVYGTVESADEVLGNGFALLKEKGELVGKELLFLTWHFNPGDYGNFVSVALLTRDGKRYIINDGSTGICGQLDDYTTRNNGRNGGLRIKNGLRVSEYDTCPGDGCSKPRNALMDTCNAVMGNGTVCGNTETKRGTGETYYIDLSA